MIRINPNIVYLCKDNITYMRSIPDKFFDLAIADPEQGKQMHGGKFYSGHAPQKNGSTIKVKGTLYDKKDWDYSIPSDEYFEELFRVSKHQVIWGAQYFRNFGPGRIIWDKINDKSHQYPCEIAYTSLTDRVELFRYKWRGMMQGKSFREGTVQQGNKKLNDPKIHPTQKPVDLYLWILFHFKIPLDWKIMDPNLGSGSIGIACFRRGNNLIGVDKDEDMILKAENWLESEILRQKYIPQIPFE